MRKIMLIMDDYNELGAFESLLRRIGFDVLSLGKELLVNDALLRFPPEIVIASAKGRSVDGLRVAARVKKLVPVPRVALAYVPGHAPPLTAESQFLIDALITLPMQPQGTIKVVAGLANIDAGLLLSKYQKLTNSRIADAEPDQELIAVRSDAKDGRPAPADSRYVASAQGQETVASSEVTGGGAAAVEVHTLESFFAMDTEAQPQAPRAPQASAKSAPDALNWDPQVQRGQAANLRSARSDRYDRFLSDHAAESEAKGVLPREKAAAAMRKLKKDAENEKDSLDRIDAEKRAFVKALFEEE